MKQFTVKELREALFQLPQLESLGREMIAKLFLEEKIAKISKRRLAEWGDKKPLGPWVHIQETYLWDAMVNLLGVPREALTLCARQHEQAIQDLFDDGDRISWTNEEWVLALLNFFAQTLTRN